MPDDLRRHLPDEVVDELLAAARTEEEIVRPGGLLSQLTKRLSRNKVHRAFDDLLSRNKVHRAFDDLVASAGSADAIGFRPIAATRCRR